MEYLQALRAAKNRATRRKMDVYVVIECADPMDYDTATDDELDSYHMGARVVAAFGPDGERAE